MALKSRSDTFVICILGDALGDHCIWSEYEPVFLDRLLTDFHNDRANGLEIVADSAK